MDDKKIEEATGKPVDTNAVRRALADELRNWLARCAEQTGMSLWEAVDLLLQTAALIMAHRTPSTADEKEQWDEIMRIACEEFPEMVEAYQKMYAAYEAEECQTRN